MNHTMQRPHQYTNLIRYIKEKTELSEQTLATFIANGQDVNAADAFGRTALFYAIKTGKIESCKTLHKKGALITTRSRTGETLLHCAVNYGQPETAAWVLSIEPLLIDEKDENLQTPLLTLVGIGYKAPKKTKRRLFHLLLKNGAQLNEVNNNGDNIIHLAVAYDENTIKTIVAFVLHDLPTSDKQWKRINTLLLVLNHVKRINSQFSFLYTNFQTLLLPHIVHNNRDDNAPRLHSLLINQNALEITPLDFYHRMADPQRPEEIKIHQEIVQLLDPKTYS